MRNQIILIDRRDYSTSSCLPRSSSIDSVAEWGLTGIGTVGNNGVSAGSSYGLFVEHPPPRRSPSPLLGVRNDRLSIVSPNIGRRVKGHRAVVGKPLYHRENVPINILWRRSVERTIGGVGSCIWNKNEIEKCPFSFFRLKLQTFPKFLISMNVDGKLIN